LGTLQYLDFRTDFDTAFRDLLWIVQNSGLNRPGKNRNHLSESSDDAASTKMMERSTSASLFVRVIRVNAPAYEEKLNISSSATIGRSAQAHLRVEDDCLSRRHARIDVVSADRRVCLTVTDLNSANGTFVNGEFIHAPRVIKPGDIVAVGSSELHVLRIGAAGSW
jgi:pSer/pThr/pTyr-binding forkhead associated (FHA) protein